MANMIPSVMRDYEQIFDKLVELAKKYSNGRWTDFTDGDFATVVIHLISFVGDLLSNQIDLSANELYLMTAEERTSLMEIIKIIGYEPRHFMSSAVELKVNADEPVVLPAYTKIVGKGYDFYTLKPASLVSGENTIYAYEGMLVYKTFNFSDINKNGQLNLGDYYVSYNTVGVVLNNGVLAGELQKTIDARFNTGDSFTFSTHLDLEGNVYLQFPSFWSDVLSPSSRITVSYLHCNGKSGNVPENTLTVMETGKNIGVSIISSSIGIGGLEPETVDELKLSAMIFARTMYTIVTRKDFEDLSYFVPAVAQVRALNYLQKESGYLQPTPPNGYPNDAYKTKLIVVPDNIEDSSVWQVNEETGEMELTVAGQSLKDFVDDKRLATLYIEYEDPNYVLPEIIFYLYMDEFAIRANSISADVVEFIKQTFGRRYIQVGESVRGSIIGRDVLNHFSDIDYVNIDCLNDEQEFQPGEEEGFEFDIKVGPLDFIDMANAKYTAYVNDKLMYVTDGFTIKKIRFGSYVNLMYDIDKAFPHSISLPFISEEDYKLNSNLLPKDIKVLWEEKGKDMVLVIPSDMLELIRISDKDYKGIWNVAEYYETYQYIWYTPEEWKYKGFWNNEIEYMENDLVCFKSSDDKSYWYKSFINSNVGLVPDVSSTEWEKVDVYYTSINSSNVGNVPSETVGTFWDTFDDNVSV